MTSVDAESDSGDSVVIAKCEVGETVGMTRERAYFLTRTLTNENWTLANSASRVAMWQNAFGCEYDPVVTDSVSSLKK